MTMHDNPVNVFISYVQKDERLLQQLEIHLSVLQRNGLILLWHKQQIVPGMDQTKEAEKQLEQASIILLLVSADFLASAYYEGEMKRALERHASGQARVIPIIARSCDWSQAPFAHIQGLPTHARPITTWRDRNEAWTTVAQGIRQTINDLAEGVHVPMSPRDPHAPEVWNVSRRHNAFFTGRNHVLQQLANDFRVESDIESISSQAITGLAGMGKTQTAAEYAYCFRKDYRNVLWVHAQTQESLITDFNTLARLLKLPKTHVEDRDALVETMHQWFRNENGWLLIFDNADDFPLVKPYIPRSGAGHVLLTTRVGATIELAQTLELQPLEVEDGALCLLRRAGLLRAHQHLEDALPERAIAAQELSQQMKGLPLALEQAGAYINDTKCGIIKYREYYKDYRAKIQKMQFGMVPDYAKPVATALMISSLMLGRESTAFELLQLCAFLAPEGIPDQFVVLTASALGPRLRPIADDPLILEQAIRSLVRYSLLEREEQSGTTFTTLSIHRILQLVLLDEMDRSTQQRWAERAVHALIQALQTTMSSVLQTHARQCLDHIAHWHLPVPEAEILQTYLKEF